MKVYDIQGNEYDLVKKNDALTYEEIQASTDLSGKIASASSIKSVFLKTWMPKGFTLNCNDAVKDGIYAFAAEVNPSDYNSPSSYGVLLTINPNVYGYIGQIFISVVGDGCFIRYTNNNSSTWSGWTKL